MAKVREIPWPEEFQELKRIEQFMICGICYEYMDTSVMTPCSHNYCSVCIRKYLHYKTQCPACFHDFFEKDLYINRAMDGLISHYLQIREKILSLIENRSVYNSVKQLEQQLEQPNIPNSPPVRPARNSQLPKNSPKVVIEKKLVDIKKGVETKKVEEKKVETKKLIGSKQSELKLSNVVNSPVASTSKPDLSSPTTNRSPKVQIPSIAKIFSTPKRKETSTPVVTVSNVKTVACPVCSVDISEQHVNVHLDACLKRETNQKTVVKQKPKRPPLPKLVLHVMKETELRKKIKEFGLSTLGDRRTLINRFTRYSVIYNAECDKPDPRPVADLIRQCEMEERQERKMDSFLVAKNTENQRLQIEKNAQEDKIEEAQKNYRIANKSSFDQLIEEVRNRRKREKEQKEKEKSQEQNDTASTSADTESVENVSENNDEAACLPPIETAFQDSDSEDECPLQVYRSDNTVKSIAVNLDDSSSCASTSASPVKRPQKGKHKISSRTGKSIIPKVEPNNVYEMETDNSTDDEVLASPLVKKNQNGKRAKLSNTCLNKSLLVPTLEEVNDVLDDGEDIIGEQDIREAAAKEVCNAIVQDFSFESDDSASEFVDKRNDTEMKKVEKAEISKTQQKIVSNLSQLKLPEEITSSSEKNSEENKACVTVNNHVDVSLCDIPLEIFSEDDFKGFVNTPAANGTNVQAQKPNENGTNYFEKENSAHLANETSQPLANETGVNRPVRKRNPPSRFVEKTPTRRVTRAKTPSETVAPNPIEEKSTDTQRSASLEGGSLKRRRGRPKMINYEDAPPDEVHNPPKRPVRRRQTVSNQTLY